jgi:long-chain acyl-CoA synthetase
LLAVGLTHLTDADLFLLRAVEIAVALFAYHGILQKLQGYMDEYNRKQPTYRQITGLVVRKNPFARSTTKKIKRQEALIDE